MLTLGALDCVTGDTLAERQTQVARKEDVLRQLGEAARELREQLGESLQSITRYDASIEQATTGSIEALKAYSQAVVARRTQGDRAALPLFRRAVALDSDFALAHARLGTVYSNLNDVEQSRRHTTRAYELRPRVSELERLYIEARYFTSVEPEPAKAIEAYRVTLATYPNDHASRVNLAILLRGQGSLDQAVSLLREAVRLAPEEPSARVNLASTLVEAGQFAEARVEAEQAIRLRDDGSSRALLVTSAVLGRDDVLEQQQLAWARAHDDPREALPVLLTVAVYRGHLSEAERLAGEAERVFGAAELWPIVAQARASVAMSLATAGANDRARAYLDRLEHDHPHEGSVDERMALAALLGDAALARRTLPLALAAAAPGPAFAAAASMQALADVAAEEFQRALHTLGPVRYRASEADRVLLHGLTLLELRRFEEALGDFEWLLTNGRKVLTSDAALVRFKKAQALDGAGRSAEARAAYAGFLEFWKTADADLPIVLEARRALARLGS